MSATLQFLVVAFLWCAGGFLFASFCEYWGHRSMHKNFLGATHRNHHATGVGQGVLREYLDYIKWGILLMWPPFFISWAAGVGWVIGTNLFAFFSAFAHQLQHDNPAGCFWMSMPIHHVHHRFNMWHYNFGMAVPWWDYVFRTYKPVEEAKWREGLDPALAKQSVLKIRWW